MIATKRPFCLAKRRRWLLSSPPVDGLADAIVNLSIDESLREISLGEDDGGEKKGEVIASFENPRIVVGSLSKGESKRVNATATFFSNRTTTTNNRKESRATISAHLTCNFGSPGEEEVSPSRHRVVAAETSKTFSFTDALEVLDSDNLCRLRHVAGFYTHRKRRCRMTTSVRRRLT